MSIESLGQTLRGAVTGGRRGTLEKAAWTVALRTEAVIRRHCWKPRQVCVPSAMPLAATEPPCGPRLYRLEAHFRPTGRAGAQSGRTH